MIPDEFLYEKRYQFVVTIRLSFFIEIFEEQNLLFSSGSQKVFFSI